jgi:hypothetical protein
MQLERDYRQTNLCSSVSEQRKHRARKSHQDCGSATVCVIGYHFIIDQRAISYLDLGVEVVNKRSHEEVEWWKTGYQADI